MAIDKDAIRREIVALLPRLRRFGYALTGNMADGDDLVQATVERALSRIDQWQPGTRLDSWMFRIAQNMWRDRLRAQKVRGPTVDPADFQHVAGEDGNRVVEERLMLAKVRETIAQLPTEQREVVALVLVEGQSYQEAADMLSIPIGTVMSRLSRARKTLQKALQDMPQQRGQDSDTEQSEGMKKGAWNEH